MVAIGVAATGGLDNDTRGWIMCSVSGIACIVGASIVYVDLLVRLLPGQKAFRIQDSNVFLASSLSLSFGVMMFSSLYSMLPSSKGYLVKGGLSEQVAGCTMMTAFIGGFIGIQVVSRVLHQFMPSHVVDCDHSHGDHHGEHHDHHHAHFAESASERSSRQPSLTRKISRGSSSAIPSAGIATIAEGNNIATESTPLLSGAETAENGRPAMPTMATAPAAGGDITTHDAPLSSNNPNGFPHHQYYPPRGRSSAAVHPTGGPPPIVRRPSMTEVRKRVMSFVKDTKANCDEFGPCYGYSDPCGQECFKHIVPRASAVSRTPALLQTHTGSLHSHFHNHSNVFDALREDDLEADRASAEAVSPTFRTSRAVSRESYFHHSPHDHEEMRRESGGGNTVSPGVSSSAALALEGGEADEEEMDDEDEDDKEAPSHHHHVPTNAFLSIGLQTVIAIAVHKFPEGFITYATNHASPALGFNVFMALFVHNIAEGFAMALPLYMALGSRPRAVAWSAALGGLSQPVGAAAAALLFHVTGAGGGGGSLSAAGNAAYGVLFAATAGIMASVALQLFVESLSLVHHRNLTIGCAFVGMALMGFSNALVKHSDA